MQHQLIVIMGVSGSGKTTIGKLLAQQAGFKFYDADSFHPAANVNKMQAGQPLTDEDRWPWLDEMNTFARQQLPQQNIVLACSALKDKYRQRLAQHIEANCKWIFLNGDYSTIYNRLQQRQNHYMPPGLLQSQFNDLEIPANAISIDIQQQPAKIVQFILSKINTTMQQFGLAGLGVMGKSLARNLANNGIQLSLYNRYVPVTEEEVALKFISAYTELSGAQGYQDVAAFATSLQSPKKIFLMVPAGEAVDEMIEQLLPYLDAGDVLIDGGNSFYKDTQRRSDYLEARNIHFVGTGVSGGEEGALKGPSIMPGGSAAAYAQVSSYLESIAAKDEAGEACCTFIGNGGAGHFVKMVHNGIEYAEMQLLAEVYSILRQAGGYTPDEIAGLMKPWLNSSGSSYLLEITVDILQKKENSQWLIDLIVDRAGNKGTGGWTTVAACELGVAIPTLTAALFARYQSEILEERTTAAQVYPLQTNSTAINTQALFNAYQLARIINHHQGFHLIHAASEQYGWKINMPELARIWTNGCIIRSPLMLSLNNILATSNRILLHAAIATQVKNSLPDLNQVVALATQQQIAIPCMASAAHYLYAATQQQSSANIIQAQRDYFGAHTYQRKDDASGKKHHTQWTS
jgi:6-phosphogluconate dehydrogenase